MSSARYLLIALTLIAFLYSAVPVSAQAGESYKYGPYIDKITMPVIKSYDQRILAFEAGELDVVGVLPRDLDRIRQNVPDAHIVFTVGYTSLGTLHFNTQLWPVKYPEVRKALAHLYDRDRIISESPLRGIAVKCTTIPPPTMGAWVNPDADFEKLYPYDPEKAKELLDRVFDPCIGPDGEPAWCDPNEGGKVVEIEVLSLPEATSPTYWWIAQYLKSEAEKIGLRIKIVPVSSRELDARTGAGTAQAWIIGWGLGRTPLFMYYFWHSREIRPGGWNEWRVNDSRVDELLDKFYYAKSIEEARKYAWEAQKILVEEIVPWIPVYTGVAITAWSGKIDRNSLTLDYAPPLKDPVGHSWFNWNTIRFVDKKFGGTLRYYFTVDITTLHPATYLWATESAAISRIYAWTMIPRPDDIYAEPRVGVLIRDWSLEEVTLEDGTKAYKFTLKFYDNITWHDGERMTAEDYVYTIAKFGKELKTRRYYDPWVDNIISIEAVDDTTAEIVLKDYGWADIYSITEMRVLPKHVFERLSNPLEDPSLLPHPTKPGLTALIGQGPFVLVKREVAYAEMVWYPEYIWRHPERTVQFEAVDVPDSVDARTPFTVRVTITDYLGNRVTNGEVKVTLRGPTTVGPLTAAHVGDGVYEVSVPGLAEGSYTVEIEASMPVMMWKLTNKFIKQITVGAAPAPAPGPAPVTVEVIEVEVPGMPQLKLSVPSAPQVSAPSVEVSTPSIEVKPAEPIQVQVSTTAVMALAILALIVSLAGIAVARPS
ncbi:MAG: ABC transporter substrate-binding protein [Thermoproteota archaeon]